MNIVSIIEATKIKKIGSGQGKNSEVYLCYDPQLDANIALKEIPTSNFSSQDEYFQEAQQLYANKHPRVVPVLYACRDTDIIRIAMPFYPNGSLQDVLDKAPLSVRKIIVWSQQFLTGLQYVHANGFIHFDVKPSNILINDDGSVLLADFGQSRPTNIHGVGQIPAMYPSHVTPEFFRYSMATIQSDIYQVGLTLYRMCNGNDFFNNQKPAKDKLRETILNGQFPNRNKFLPHIPNRLKRIIRKALEIEPGMRQQTISDLMNELGQVNTLLDWEYFAHNDDYYWKKTTMTHDYYIRIIKSKNKFYIEGYSIRRDTGLRRNKHEWSGGPYNTLLQAMNSVSEIFRNME